MASTTALRRFVLAAARPTRSFHSSARAWIKVGDKLPQLSGVLVEDSPGKKVDVSELSSGKALLIGVPAAFSKSLIIDDLRDLVSLSMTEHRSTLANAWKARHALILTFRAISIPKS
jgi:hypothetical protein